MTWVYSKSGKRLWTVGFYTPDGVWESDADYDSREEEAARVHYLNGGADETLKEILKAVKVLDNAIAAAAMYSRS